MENNTNWIQHYGFILVAFAHMTDWKLLDSELEVVQKKMEYIILSMETMNILFHYN